MKRLLIELIVFLFVVLIQILPAQTVDFDGHSISIGDSLEQVISKFDSDHYSMSCDTIESSSITYRIYKLSDLSQNDPGNSTRTRRCIGYLYFTYSDTSSIPPPSRLYQIGKIWSDWGNSNSLSLIEAVFNVLENDGVDKYNQDISFSKGTEPNNRSKRITLKISPNIILEIYIGDSDYYLVTEYITADKTKNSKQVYLVIFDDTMHLISKTENIITREYTSEAEAESGLNMLQIQYIAMRYSLPFSKIIKFPENRLVKVKAKE